MTIQTRSPAWSRAQSVCPVCHFEYPYRSNKKFCSPNCRKNSSQRALRKQRTENNTYSPTKARINKEHYELAMRLAETLYTMPTNERLGYIESLIQLARSGISPKLRNILTDPTFVWPDPNDRHLFFRGCREYCTIAQAVDRYCRASPWNSRGPDVVRGITSEPETGEVVMN